MTFVRRRACAATLVFSTTLIVGCAREAPEEVESETVVPVETAPALRGDITGVVYATGTVTPAPGAELIVVAPEPARIAELPHAEGELVAAGDLLVRFDIPASGAEVGRQRGEIARAEAQIANARAAQTRAKDMFERGIAARKEMEDADRDLAEAEAVLAEAQAALAAADSVAARAVVRAPFAGVVARRLHNPGDVVEAAATDPVLRLIDPRRMEVVANVSLGDVMRVALGAPARLRSGSALALRVVSRPLAVDAGTAAAPVRLTFTGPAPGLAFGTPVQVEIEAETRAGVVLVPVGAVVREGEETAVFIAAEEKAARHPVTLGISDGTHVEVTFGIAAGDLVITRGQAGLPDGAAIAVGAAKP
jgi:RND family efflux transporter MFP subunit